jgi:hypothetical protein
MEDLTPGFDEWLVVQRERMAAEAEPFTGTHAWVDKFASMLPASAVVLLRVTPATDGRAEAQVLATALRRQLLEGPEVGSRPSVRLLPPPFDDGQARAVARDGESIWVVPLPAYGEEPLCVLEMRSMLRPERLFEVEVPPLSWPVARSDVLSELPFERAAPIYLQSGGNASFLAELMESGPDVLPPRIHAAYLWEARHASLDARLALERLSVHPGPLPWTLIEVFEAQPSWSGEAGWRSMRAGGSPIPWLAVSSTSGCNPADGSTSTSSPPRRWSAKGWRSLPCTTGVRRVPWSTGRGRRPASPRGRVRPFVHAGVAPPPRPGRPGRPGGMATRRLS